jgi:spore coat-associated protein N
MRFTLNSTGGKALASTVVLGAAASIAGLGTFGTFTSTTSATASAASGNVAITLGATGAGNRLNVSATGLVPGDTVQRAVQLSNAAGNQDLAGITLTTTAPKSSVLDTDPTNGLRLSIDSCPSAWTEGGSATNGYTYTCSVATKTVLGSQAVKGTDMALTDLTSTKAGNTDYLRVTLTLPSAAGNTVQSQSSELSFAFSGTQRAATSR